MADNARAAFGQQVYRFMLDKGLPPHQAAAVAGNMAWEGGGRTDGINPNDNLRGAPGAPHSFGISQWNGDRLKGLIDSARSQGKDIPAGDLRDVNYLRSIAPQLDLQTQLGHVWNEMQGPEARAYAALTGGTDLRSATAGAISYHRPAGFSWGNPMAGHGFDGRYRLADTIMRAGPGEAPAGAPAPAPAAPAEAGGKAPILTAGAPAAPPPPMSPPAAERPPAAAPPPPAGLLGTIAPDLATALQGMLGQQNNGADTTEGKIRAALEAERERSAQQADDGPLAAPMSLAPHKQQAFRMADAQQQARAPMRLGVYRR